VVQCGAVCCSVLQCFAVCCSMVQCVAVCCSVLQCVAVWLWLYVRGAVQHSLSATPMHLSHLLLVLKDHLVRRSTHELSHDASISSPTCATMGCLRLVGSLKLQISFAKEPCQRDDILQKSHVILRSLLIVATPYISLASTSSPI